MKPSLTHQLFLAATKLGCSQDLGTVWVLCPECEEEHAVLVGEAVTLTIAMKADQLHWRN